MTKAAIRAGSYFPGKNGGLKVDKATDSLYYHSSAVYGWLCWRNLDKSSMTHWKLPVEELEGDLVITLPQDLLDAAELQIGDTLTWHIDDQGRVTLNKKEADGKD